MAPRAIASGTISFGLVSIPVRLYVATQSEQLHFNMLHQRCGSRIRQQLFCPRCEKVVERGEIVKGYEFAKDQYVTFTDEELKALEVAASPAIEIQEFVPLAKVDPIYFEDAHYLGPDKGGEKAYHLLVEAMRETSMVALAQHVSRGKEQLVLIRPMDSGLVLHSLYYADEVRRIDEIEKGEGGKVRGTEKDLARQLVAQLASDEFRPAEYHDHYRERLQEVVQKKVAGEEVTAAPAQPQRARVIDLMDALKQSLAREGRRAAGARAPAVAAARRRPATAQRRARKK